MKLCCTSLLFACLVLLVSNQAFAQNAPSDLATSGRVDGAFYRNTYFGLNYYVPEQWSARVSVNKLPGLTTGYLLATMKRKFSGDPLSTITVNAFDLAPYGGDLMRFLDARYRLRRDAVESETTINGNHKTHLKGAEFEPETVVLSDRTYYRLQVESTGMSRVTMATTEKGYAVVFELISPARFATDTTTQFLDSLHGVTFGVNEPPKTQAK